MFSKEWKKVYKSKHSKTLWPWSEMISLVSRHTKEQRKIKILELGCGPGANIPFFLKKKFDYYAVEGSSEAVNLIKKRYPSLKKKIIVADFTQSIPFKTKFDLIVDRGSLTHNDVLALQNTSQIIDKVLKKKGLIIINDWFSKKDSYAQKGIKVDEYTRNKIQGRFKNIGKVNFADAKLFKSLFNKYKIIEMYERIFNYSKPKKNHKLATWTLVLKK